MRKEYGKVLRQCVEQRMKASSFGWQLHREKSIYAIPGERAFRKDLGGQLVLWCMLVPNQKFESFTIELGWSMLGRYPELSVRPPPQSHDQAQGRQEYLVRLSQLTHGNDHWWEVEPFVAPASVEDAIRMIQPVPAELARSRVLPVIDEALLLLARDGEPYLERIARQST